MSEIKKIYILYLSCIEMGFYSTKQKAVDAREKMIKENDFKRYDFEVKTVTLDQEF